jgi:hypothetical protein
MSAALTESDLRRWLHLRAIEWANWPAYLSQPVVPVLLIFFRWFYVLGGVLALAILWAFVRYSFVNSELSRLGTQFVVYLKWPAALASAIYFLFVAHRYGVGALALLWPMLAGFVPLPGQVGRIELMLAKNIGYVDEDARLDI